jgi:hypothetical protein
LQPLCGSSDHTCAKYLLVVIAWGRLGGLECNYGLGNTMQNLLVSYGNGISRPSLLGSVHMSIQGVLRASCRRMDVLELLVIAS